MSFIENPELRRAFTDFFAKESPVEKLRATENSDNPIIGFDSDLWEKVRTLGIPGLAIEGASLSDLAVIAECAGRQLAPVPIVESFVALRLIDRVDKKQITKKMISGESIVTISLSPVKNMSASLVPAGLISDAVVALSGNDLIIAKSESKHIATVAPSSMGQVSFVDHEVLENGVIAQSAFDKALTDWRILRASALVGLGNGALALGIEYVQSRKQFDVPVGSFQAVQHQLADLATDHQGASLLMTAAATETDVSRRALLARMAYWFAGRSARAITKTVLHFHGGYGFMLEYDPQLFFRLATAWSIELGDPASELNSLADELDLSGWVLPDLYPSSFRLEVRKFLAANCPPEVVEKAHSSGTMHNWELHRALAHQGLLAADWPVEMGGQNRNPGEMFELGEELARVGAPIDGWGISNLVAHTLNRVGTEAQKKEIIPSILRGEVLCALGYSEPDAGSDVAATITFAQSCGDDWIINGQKVFTTLAHESNYIFLLTRTNRELSKHRGLTMFLVPTNTPGLEVVPIETLGGERTNMTFYSDVRVHDSCRVGEINGGWDVMGVALAYERNPTMVGELGLLCAQFAAWARESGALERPAVRARLASAVVDYQVGRLFGGQLTAKVAQGELPYLEGSMAKLFASEALVRAASDFVDATGASGQLALGAPGAPGGGWIEHAHRHAQVTTIHAGTSEIQRSIIAERGLGLPRSRGN